jgi:hypothetical protein
MKLQLFLEDVHQALVGALSKRGYDARHTGEKERLGMPDKDQLGFAAGEGCCPVRVVRESPISRGSPRSAPPD